MARKINFANTSIITLLSETNPKKPGSKAHARFANYKSGQTVEEALKAGLRRDDLAWDTAHGFIKIEAVAAAEEPKEKTKTEEQTPDEKVVKLEKGKQKKRA